LIVRVAVVAPEIFPPFVRLTPPLRHWYEGLVPEAATVKLADEPEHKDWDEGWPEIAGG
jgi:hypothetical protein